MSPACCLAGVKENKKKREIIRCTAPGVPPPCSQVETLQQEAEFNAMYGFEPVTRFTLRVKTNTRARTSSLGMLDQPNITALVRFARDRREVQVR